jgi:triphosphatase
VDKSRSHDEIELKLSLDRGQVALFRRHALLRSLAQGRARTHHVVTTYFDTAGLALQRKGAALRVRRRDGRERLQTLKVPARRNGAATAQHFLEFETPVASETPDLDRIAGAEGEALKANILGGDDLRPVFTTEFDRRVLPVRLVDTDIEVALDVGEVRAGETAVPICEAELELKSGKPARLFELALALHETLPLRIERRTKAARGYGLVTGMAPVPVKAEPVELARGVTVERAFRQLAASCLGHMLANEPVVLHSTDPEGVHQMRVGLRRLRALLGMFDHLVAREVADYLRDELRWLQQQLGPARDWDVFIGETLQRITLHDGKESGLDTVLELAEAARAEAYETARAAIRDPRFTGLILRLDVWLDAGVWADHDDAEIADALSRPLGGFARAALDRRERRMRKLAGRFESLDEAGLHKLRIRGKNLRYAAEFFRSLYRAKPARRYLAVLREIQDALGTLNDAVVSRGLLDEIDGRARAARIGRARMARARALIEGWNLGRIDSGLARFPEMWSRLAALERFWDDDER